MKLPQLPLSVPAPVLGGRAQLAVFAVLAVLLLAHVGAYFNFSEDDPGISFRYAVHLAEGQGLVYNPGGGPVEGYSNFGHVLWLAVLYLTAAGGDRMALIVVVKLANLVLALLCLGLWFRRLNNDPELGAPVAVVSSVLLVAAGSFAISTASALETVGVTLLLMLAAFALDCYLASGTPDRRRTLALIAALVPLSIWRIDAPWLALLLGLFLLLERRGRPCRQDVLVAVAVGVFYAGYTVFRFATFGQLLPNTFYAKISLDASLAGGWPYLARFFAAHGSVVAVAVVVLLGACAPSRLERLAAFLVAGQLLFVALVEGDWIPGFRFLVPVVPFLTLLAARPLLALRRLGSRAVGWAACGAAVLVSCAALVRGNARDYIDPGMRQPLSWYARPTLSPTQLTPYSGIGRWMDARFGPDATIAIAEGGFIPFLCDRETLDTFGLCTPEIAQLEGVPRDRWGVRTSLLDGAAKATRVVLAHEPDALLVAPWVPDELPEEVHGKRYQLVKLIPVNQFAGGLRWSRSSPLKCAVYARSTGGAFLEAAIFDGPRLEPGELRSSHETPPGNGFLSGARWRVAGGGPVWLEGRYPETVHCAGIYLGEAGSEEDPQSFDLRVKLLVNDEWREVASVAGRNVGLTLDGSFDDSLLFLQRELGEPLAIDAVRVEMDGAGMLRLDHFALVAAAPASSAL